MPIIPFALVNGIKGIGTGFSCSVPPYNPADLILNIKKMLKGDTDLKELIPYYEGFKGTVEKIESDKYLIKGVMERSGPDTIIITELPVGKWTMQYTKMLEEMMDGGVDKDGKKITPVIKDFTSLCTEVNVHFTVVFPKGKIDEVGMDGIEKLLKLSTTIRTSNIHMFNAERKLKKYENVEELVRDYYDARLITYGKRKEHLLDALAKKTILLSNKARYIEYNLNDKIDLRRKTAAAVDALLLGHSFDKFDGDYKYLIKMPMDSVTAENVEKLLRDRDETVRELEILRGTTLEQMWLRELNTLETKYEQYKKIRENLQSVVPKKTTTAKKVVKK
jgi:DNA topoisomerase-2